MKAEDLKPFQLPSLRGQTPALSESEKFVLQPLDQQVPVKPSYSEAELVSQAERILAEAEARRQLIEQQAYEAGFRQGQKDGREVGRRGLEEIIQRLEKLLQALLEEKEELFRQREADLVELVRLISRKIILRELSLRPEAIRDLVEAGAKKLFDTEQLRLLVHPQDYELLADSSRNSWPPGLELVPDPGVSPGGFRLETDRGDLDGTLETRWAQVSEVIDQVLGRKYED